MVPAIPSITRVNEVRANDSSPRPQVPPRFPRPRFPRLEWTGRCLIIRFMMSTLSV